MRDYTPSEQSLARFRTLYEQTARPLWRYLARCLGDSALSDDLLQASYVRLLSTEMDHMDDAHVRDCLFRIATNLMRDHWRHTARCATTPLNQAPQLAGGVNMEARTDVT